MKKTILVLSVISFLLTGLRGQTISIATIAKGEVVSVAQNIQIVSAADLHDGIIETSGDLIFVGGVIDLGRITIKAKKITIKAAVTSFIFCGNVTLQCKDLMFELLPGLPTLNAAKVEINCVSKGESIIACSNTLSMNNRVINQTPVNGIPYSFKYLKQ